MNGFIAAPFSQGRGGRVYYMKDIGVRLKIFPAIEARRDKLWYYLEES